jgi:hypothetical protein
MIPTKTPTQSLGVMTALLLGLTLPISAHAIGDGSKLKIAQIRYNGAWDTRKKAPLVLAQEVRFRTSIDVQLTPTVVGLTDPAFFELPFALLTGNSRFRLSTRERSLLKKWLEGGGFLLVDNTGRSEPSPGFDQSIRTVISDMFPNRTFKKIPPQHVLYRTFYILDYPAGRVIRRPFLEGLFLDGRVAVVYSQNDLTGAMDRDRLGAWTYDVAPGGEEQREKAKRLATNIIQYAMCLDYKDDQVHLDHLLHKRRWKIQAPTIQAP